MKVVVMDAIFEPDDDFKQFLEANELTIYCNEFTYSEKVVNYIETHCNWHGYRNHTPAIKGASSYEYKIGFCGACFVVDVDTSKLWTIKWNDVDEPYPCYISIKKDKYNRVWIGRDLNSITNKTT